MDNNSLSHAKWNYKYHIVFAPKYRRKMVTVHTYGATVAKNWRTIHCECG